MLQCNEVKIDIDTGSTTTTRKWQIKITQYACGNLMAPEQDCLQYHTEASGRNPQPFRVSFSDQNSNKDDKKKLLERGHFPQMP